MDEAGQTPRLGPGDDRLHRPFVVGRPPDARLVVWLQARVRAFRVRGYCAGVVSCFSARQPRTRISSASSSMAPELTRRSGPGIEAADGIATGRSAVPLCRPVDRPRGGDDAMEVQELGHIVLYVRNVRAVGRLLPRRPRLAPDHAGRERAQRRRHRLPGRRLLGPVGTDPPRVAPHRGGRGCRRRAPKVGGSASTTSVSRSATPTRNCARRSRQLEAAGATVVGASDHTVTHSLYIEDPDGNEIELYVDVPGVDWKTHPELLACAHQATAHLISPASSRPPFGPGSPPSGSLTRQHRTVLVARSNIWCTGVVFGPKRTPKHVASAGATGVGHVDRSRWRWRRSRARRRHTEAP